MYFDNLPDQLPRLEKQHFSGSADFSRPLVFDDIMDKWPAYGKWSLEYLKVNYGVKRIIAEKSISKDFYYRSFLVSEFIDYAYNTKEADPFIARTNIHLATDLKSDYDASSYFPCWYRQWYRDQVEQKQRIGLSDMFIGPKNSYSHLHIDIWGTSFWNALFHGAKLWLFFDKEQNDCLYEGAVNPFYPDFSKYPKFRNAEPRVWIQRPGELIYCPGNIYHAVYALESSLALSENFIDSRNFTYVLDFFQRSGFMLAYTKMSRIKERYLATFPNTGSPSISGSGGLSHQN
jgi:hypothetical protein